MAITRLRSKPGVMSCQLKRSLTGSPIPLAERWHAILSSHLESPFPAVYLAINRKTPLKYFVSFHHGQLRRQTGAHQFAVAAEITPSGTGRERLRQVVQTGSAPASGVSETERLLPAP